MRCILHHSAGGRPNFWNCTTATGVTQLWCCVSIHIVNCLITQLLTYLHPAFTKFCCRLHYKSHTSWSLHHSAGCRRNFCNCTTATGVTQLWCCVSIHAVNCLITQLSTHLHPVFMKFCCRFVNNKLVNIWWVYAVHVFCWLRGYYLKQEIWLPN
jgi:hypothetical protein